MEFFVPPGRGRALARVLDRGPPRLVPRARPARLAAPRARARAGRAVALLARDERHRVPLPDRLVRARGRRLPRRLRPAPAHRGLRHEARVRRSRRLALHAARDRARGLDRPDPARSADRRVRRGRGRGARADAPAPAPVGRAGQGRGAAAHLQGGRGHGRAGAPALRGAASAATSSSTTTAGTSGGATGGRTRSARRGRSRSTT